jgi:hypothetical protein
MVREAPGRAEDSGWVFLAGDESQAYLDEPNNLSVYDVNTIANYDPSIIPYFYALPGQCFDRIPWTNCSSKAPIDADRAAVLATRRRRAARHPQLGRDRDRDRGSRTQGKTLEQRDRSLIPCTEQHRAPDQAEGKARGEAEGEAVASHSSSAFALRGMLA